MDNLVHRRHLGVSLRDIRPDLEARLLSAQKSFDEHSAKAKSAGDEVAELTRMLERENQRFAPTRTAKAAPADSLTDYLFARLKEGSRLTKEQLRVLALEAGYNIDGRSIHATVMNLLKSGFVSDDGNGTYYVQHE
jgi:hypothetical protein